MDISAIRSIFVFLLANAALTGLSSAQKDQPLTAVAYIEGSGGTIKGNITFTQKACGEPVYIRVNIVGLEPGHHGFHVHEKGDLTNGCASTGSHYNPDKMEHGAPNDEVRHVGDLGNIVADQSGQVDTTITDHLISLAGHRSIIGRGLVIHSGKDDLGKGGDLESKKTGNAGGRVACGVIGINTGYPSKEWLCTSSAASGVIVKNSLLAIAVMMAITYVFSL